MLWPPASPEGFLQMLKDENSVVYNNSKLGCCLVPLARSDDDSCRLFFFILGICHYIFRRGKSYASQEIGSSLNHLCQCELIWR